MTAALKTDNVSFLDLSPSGGEFQADQSYALFHSEKAESPSLVDRVREGMRVWPRFDPGCSGSARIG